MLSCALLRSVPKERASTAPASLVTEAGLSLQHRANVSLSKSNVTVSHNKPSHCLICLEDGNILDGPERTAFQAVIMVTNA